MSRVLDGIQVRYLVAIAITAVALLVLGGVTLLGGDDADVPGDGGGDPTSTTTAPSTTAPTADPEPPEDTTTTTIAIRPDWFPKQTSRYSDRQPVVTVSTLPPTTTERPVDESSGNTSGSSSGNSRSSSGERD